MSSRRIFAGLSLILVLFCVSSFGKYSGGSGEPNDPYLIATPEDLNSVGLDPCDWDKHFLMTADINMAGITGDEFNIIGDYFTASFSGVFDGNGHSILNFTFIENNKDFVGIFGAIFGPNALVKSLTLLDVNIVGDGLVGALVGLGGGSIIDCAVIGGSVLGEDTVGGLAGEFYDYSIPWAGTISNCCARVQVTGDYAVGGLIGWNYANVDSCFSTGDVVGTESVGGLIGRNFDRGGGNIHNSYSLANVQGDSRVGGLIGSSFLTKNKILENCFSAGFVDGNDDVGAFLGGYVWSSASFIYSSCFWDREVNRDVNGLGEGIDPNVIGLPTAELQKRNTFADAGWDMVNVWDIGENQTYPFLRKHLPSDINKDGETNLYDLAILALNWLEQ